MKKLLQHPLFWITAWCLWCTSEYWAFGDLSYLYIHDNADQVLPFTAWITSSTSHWISGKMVPILCGLDRMSSTAWITLVHPFFIAFPGWLAHGLFLFFQRWIMGFFAFLYFRDALRFRPPHAALAAMAYTLVHLEHGEIRLMHLFNEPGFPLLLWAFHRVPAQQFRISGMLGMIVLGLFIGLSMDPVAAMPFFFPTALLLALITRDDLLEKSDVARLLGMVVLCGLVTLPFKIPGLQALLANAPMGHRADWDAGLGLKDALLQLASVKVLFLARWWLALLLAVPWFFTRCLKTRNDVAILTLLLVGLFLGPVLQALVYVFGDQLGFLRGFSMLRFDRVAPLALLAAAAGGLRVLEQHRGPTFGRPMIFTLLLMGAALHTSYGVKLEHWGAMRGNGQNWRAIFGNAEIEFLAKTVETKKEPWRCATAGAYHLSHPMYLLQYGLETADGYAVLYPNRYQRYWGEVLGPLMAQEDTFRGHFTGWGSRVYLFHSQKPELALTPSVPLAQWANLDLLSLANVRFLVSHKPIQDERLRMLPQVWSEENRDAWAAQPLGDKMQDYLHGENPGSRRFVYENTNAVSRVFAVPGQSLFETEDELYKTLGTTDLAHLRASVFFLREDLPEDLQKTSSGPAEVSLLDYHPESVQVEVFSGEGTWLVMSSLYYPWWKARIDGEPTIVFPAYGAFMAVHVPPGKHRVDWSYTPEY